MKQNENLTEGNLWKKMFLFSVPLILTNVMQAIYNIVDMVIVGQFAGALGLAAVTIGGQVTMVVLMIIVGFANGGSVIIAKLIGEKRQREIQNVMGTMFIFFVLIAIIITTAVICFTNPLLEILNTPAESYVQSVRYLRICTLGTLFVYLYNLFSASLRGIGNSKVPMFLVLISSAVNIGLDLLFVGGFSMNASGAALATVISQILSACLAMFYMVKRTEYFKLKKEVLRIRRDCLKTLLKIGFPQSIQFTLTNLSFLFIGGLVNIYGVNASAAAGATSKICSFAVLAAQAVMGAIATAGAQNTSVKQYGRAVRAMGMGILYSLPLAVVLYLLCIFNTGNMLGMFTTDVAVIEIGNPYLKIVAVSFLIESVMFCLMGLLIGSGYTNVTMACGIISSFGVRYGLARILSMHMGFLGIGWAYMFAPIGSCIICGCFILSGRWKKNRIKI